MSESRWCPSWWRPPQTGRIRWDRPRHSGRILLAAAPKRRQPSRAARKSTKTFYNSLFDNSYFLLGVRNFSVSLPAGRPSGRTEAHVCSSNFGRRGWRKRGEVRAQRSGALRAATPADEMDKTVNVSVMEGLNTDVRGNEHLRGNRNRACDSE